jgi:hypothetical protein
LTAHCVLQEGKDRRDKLIKTTTPGTEVSLFSVVLNMSHFGNFKKL